jgi:pimeloyl-ACP methyl ester carboxylesterase
MNSLLKVKRLLVALSFTAALGAGLGGCASAGSTGVVSSSADPAPALSAVRHVTVDGMSMGYRTGGTGPALVMIIGRGATMAEWDPQFIAQFITDHRVVVFDNRGVGTSDNPSTATLTAQQMAKDTLGLMNALDIKSADLLGWSMGGMIAQQVTIDAPGRVDRLVLCATSPGGSHAKQPSEAVQKEMDSPDLSTATLLTLSFPPDKAGLTGAVNYAFRVATQPDLVPGSFTISSATRANQEKATAQWKSADGGSYDELPGVRQPTFVLWGADDQVEPPYNDQLIVDRVPGARKMVFPDAGHGFLFQDAVPVGQAIRAFLG